MEIVLVDDNRVEEFDLADKIFEAVAKRAEAGYICICQDGRYIMPTLTYHRLRAAAEAYKQLVRIVPVIIAEYGYPAVTTALDLLAEGGSHD